MGGIKAYEGILLDIDEFRALIKTQSIIWRNHALIRMRQRNISVTDILNCIMKGQIIEPYPNSMPFPCALVMGPNVKGTPIHVVCASGQEQIWMITAYYPDPNEWMDDLKTRRE
jgi:hypothetical protein